MSIKNILSRIDKLEKQDECAPTVLRVVYEATDTSKEMEDGEWSGNATKLEVFSPEEEAILQKYEEETVAAAKPGEIVAIFWTKHQAQKLLGQTQNGQDPAMKSASRINSNDPDLG